MCLFLASILTMNETKVKWNVFRHYRTRPETSCVKDLLI